MNQFDVIIIGGGAAGFFAAINMAEFNPSLKIAILEKGKSGLQKVRISGGGRCNVTHAEFIPSELVQNYPRGEKELLGPFHQFMTGDTIEWFEKRGVELKIEEDGRMFPVSNTSQTIIECFLNEIKRLEVEVFYSCTVKNLSPQGESSCLNFEIETNNDVFLVKKVLIATGSNPKMWKLMDQLGHTIVPPVPSLFTFDIEDERIIDIAGVVAKDVKVSVVGAKLISEGPLLITHGGMSAPAILKLSAFGALKLAQLSYNFNIEINFVKLSIQECLDELKQIKQSQARKLVWSNAQFDLPKRLWKKLVEAANIIDNLKWADINKLQLEQLAKQLCQANFRVNGKSTFKEEFVTAGGVDLREINFKTYESRVVPNLYFAGEVLNIDAVTGGFNFQNAWTGAYIAARAITET